MKREEVGQKTRYGKQIVARNIADDCMTGDAAHRPEHGSMVSSRAEHESMVIDRFFVFFLSKSGKTIGRKGVCNCTSELKRKEKEDI